MVILTVSNYRPVSILPIVSKILEKIVAKQLSYYLENNKLLSNCLHGFRSKLSTETALTTITDKLYDYIDNKTISMLTLCDLSKAFDTVNHKTLLDKCSLLNIDKFWNNNYLNNRTVSVRVGNHISKKKSISYGSHRVRFLGRFYLEFMLMIYLYMSKVFWSNMLMIHSYYIREL